MSTNYAALDNILVTLEALGYTFDSYEDFDSWLEREVSRRHQETAAVAVVPSIMSNCAYMSQDVAMAKALRLRVPAQWGGVAT